MPDPNKPKQPRARPSTPRYGEGKPARRAGGRRQVDDAFEDLLDAFTTHLNEVRCLTFATQHSYAKGARGYYRWLVATEPAVVLTEASSSTIRAFVTFRRGQGINPGTIATSLQALKSFYDFLLLDDLTRPNPTKGVRGPRVIPPPIDPFTEDECPWPRQTPHPWPRNSPLTATT
jgi:site-specific recombinase XerD